MVSINCYTLCRKDVWATFPRQEEAIRFLKGHAQAKLFSYQDHLSGQRRFLASTYNEFWRRLPCNADFSYSEMFNLNSIQ